MSKKKRWVWLTLKYEFFLSIPLQVFSLLKIGQQKELELGHLIKYGSNLWGPTWSKIEPFRRHKDFPRRIQFFSCHGWVGPTYLLMYVPLKIGLSNNTRSISLDVHDDKIGGTFMPCKNASTNFLVYLEATLHLRIYCKSEEGSYTYYLKTRGILHLLLKNKRDLTPSP